MCTSVYVFVHVNICVYVCLSMCAYFFLHDMCTCLCVRLFKHLSMMYVSYVSLFMNVLHKDFFFESASHVRQPLVTN